MTTSTDRAELIELMGLYADIADLREFTALPHQVYADPVTLDFASVIGLPPMTVPLAEYLPVLRGAFASFKATHHSITGHVIDIDTDRATIHAHVRAEHWVPDGLADRGADRWLVVGFYDNEAIRTADGWRLSSVKLTAHHQENAHLSSPTPEAGRTSI
ncbi:hypothetical protein GCM10010145_35270 [Streptomyces ruber]|uniref:SnoaL-like domain-containing protein n=2 Tax=Streptomyces TaxID=1883 RepID=A0A918BFU3_9ACTN|nr:nuclear transport factor 2 family protein [Streptomyces ruber]GGQ62318.1 hypothetical protein GCM10010145_35270 [Streptomyces ruber]